MANGPWILFLDADEEISQALKEEIIAEFSSDRIHNVNGYEFPRLVRYLGRWITHGDWYPDVKLRLFRKDKGTCGGKEPHDRTTVIGLVKRMKSPIFHYTYTGISDQLSSLNSFTSISAKGKYCDGIQFGMSDVLLRPILRFIRCYFLRLGFLDGLPGLIIATTVAYGVFTKYAKLWEIQREQH
jgi:hypothetical protein